MRKIILFLALILSISVSFSQSPGSYTPVAGKWEYIYLKIDKGIKIPQDTLPTADTGSIAIKGSTLYIHTFPYWTAITGAGGSGVWGFISGSITSQTDLQAALNAKLDTSKRKVDTLYAITDSTFGMYINGQFRTFKARGAIPSFNGRTGAITLAAVDVINALGYSPLPAGGTTGQALTKNSSTDYDVSWQTVSGGGSTDTTSLSNRINAKADTTGGVIRRADTAYLHIAATTQPDWSEATTTAIDYIKNKPTSMLPSGPAGGDLTGTYPNPTIANNAITDAKLRQSAGLSVIGRSANSTGNVADITASTPYRYLGSNGSTLGYYRPMSIIDVREYGVVGDSSTDNTTALQNLFNNINPGDRIYFPAGWYKINGTVYIKTPNITISGVNGNMSYDYSAGKIDTSGTIIMGTSATVNMLVDSAVGLKLNDISFINTSSTKTSGAGLKLVNGGYFIINNCTFRDFYNNVEIYNSALWNITDSRFFNKSHYNIYIENPIEPDAGDAAIIGTQFIGDDTAVTHILQKSGGGLKILGSKFNSLNGGGGPFPKRCLDLAINGATAVLVVSGNSFENFRDYGISVVGTTASFNGINITGNHISAYHNINGNYIKIGANVTNGLIAGNTFVGSPSATGIDLTGSDKIDVGVNNWDPIYTTRYAGHYPVHASAGITMDGVSNGSDDVNIINTRDNTNSIGIMSAFPNAQFDPVYGPFLLLRGNAYSVYSGQRGNAVISAGLPTSPLSTEGLIRFLTGGNIVAEISNAGNLKVNNLATGLTAPTTSGTTKMVVTDANGQLSFASIPSSGITSINSQTGSTQTLAGGAGLIVNSSSNTHTIDFTTNLDVQVTDANNTGTSATDLYSKTIAANQCTLNGQSIHFEAAGTNNDATATVNLQALFAGNGIAGTGAVTISATGVWSMQGTIIRASSTTARVYTVVTIDNCTQKVFSTTANLTGIDWTTTNVLKIQATAGGAGGGSNDITAQMWKVVFQP